MGILSDQGSNHVPRLVIWRAVVSDLQALSIWFDRTRNCYRTNCAKGREKSTVCLGMLMGGGGGVGSRVRFVRIVVSM